MWPVRDALARLDEEVVHEPIELRALICTPAAFMVGECAAPHRGLPIYSNDAWWLWRSSGHARRTPSRQRVAKTSLHP